MQPTTSTTSPIAVPAIDTDEPVAVIPAASVAPLDGPPTGERINTFIVAPKTHVQDQMLRDLSDRVLDKPLTYVLGAFSLGFLIARVLR